jgi:hypothetical protein
MSDTVELDVGGKRFKTTRTTLCAHAPESFLARMFDPKNEHSFKLAQADGSYFIDRSPVLFEHLLEGLRNAHVPEAIPGVPLKLWRRELDFYQIVPDKEAVAAAEGGAEQDDASDTDGDRPRKKSCSTSRFIRDAQDKAQAATMVIAEAIRGSAVYKKAIVRAFGGKMFMTIQINDNILPPTGPVAATEYLGIAAENPSKSVDESIRETIRDTLKKEFDATNVRVYALSNVELVYAFLFHFDY